MDTPLLAFGLDVLACPICKSSLEPVFKNQTVSSLRCNNCNYYFSIRNGIVKLFLPKKFQKNKYHKHLSVTAKTYDKYSKLHDFVYHNPKMEYMRKIEIDALKYANIKGTVLDMGCGTGKYTELLARKGCNVIAMDISQKMLEITRKKLNKQKLQKKVLLVQSDADTLPFQENKFDGIIGIFGVLNHVLTYKTVFEKIFQMLKPEGVLVFSVLNTYRLQWFLFEIFKKRRIKTILKLIRNRDGYLKFPVKGRRRRVFCHNYTVPEIQKLLKKAGFKIKKIGGIYILVYPQFRREENLELKGIDKVLAWMEDKIRWVPPFNMLGYYIIVIAKKPKKNEY